MSLFKLDGALGVNAELKIRDMRPRGRSVASGNRLLVGRWGVTRRGLGQRGISRLPRLPRKTHLSNATRGFYILSICNETFLSM